jgi:hypothetical protein
MKRYVIERELPGAGSLSAEQLAAAAATSNQALAEFNGKAQWVHSYVTGDRTYCVYLADSPDTIREHARRSGFTASRISESPTIIDPTTANGAKP